MNSGVEGDGASLLKITLNTCTGGTELWELGTL